MNSTWCGAIISAAEAASYDQIPGIYAFVHLESGRRYIGQTENICNRRSTHFSGVRRGNHHCPTIAELAKTTPADGFAFVLLAICRRSDLDYAERAACLQGGDLVVNRPSSGRAHGEDHGLIREGRRIAAQRMAMGLSVEQLANMAGLAPHTVAALEYGLGVLWVAPWSRVRQALATTPT